MKKVLVVVCLCIYAVGFSQKTYDVKYFEGITIDGDLSDWDLISFTDEFVDHELGTVTSNVQSTKVKVAWDSNNLFVAFISNDRDITATEGDQDATIFKTDDLVEIFIDADGNGVDYIEIGANAKDVYYDYILECVSSTCGGWKDNQGFDLNDFEVKSTFLGTLNNVIDTDVEYVVEIKIPFSSLNLIPNGGFTTPEEGDKWRANFFRIDPNVWSATQFLSWSPHNSSGFHQPSKFGELVFVGNPLTNLNENDISTLTIYPNPSSTEVNFNEELNSLRVFSMFGEEVMSVENVKFVNVSGLQSGLYVFNMEVNGSFVSKKVTVK